MHFAISTRQAFAVDTFSVQEEDHTRAKQTQPNTYRGHSLQLVYRERRPLNPVCTEPKIEQLRVSNFEEAPIELLHIAVRSPRSPLLAPLPVPDPLLLLVRRCSSAKVQTKRNRDTVNALMT